MAPFHRYCHRCGSTVRLLIEVFVDPDDISDDRSVIHAVARELKCGDSPLKCGDKEVRNWPHPKSAHEGYCTQCQQMVTPVGKASQKT